MESYYNKFGQISTLPFTLDQNETLLLHSKEAHSTLLIYRKTSQLRKKMSRGNLEKSNSYSTK